MVANTGSTARDFLATERNFLTQCRLGLIFSLLSSSFLLRARIPTSQHDQPSTPDPARIPFGTLYFLSGICVICLGLWYYSFTTRRLIARRAFLGVTNFQAATVTIGAGLILTTCIVLLVDDDL